MDPSPDRPREVPRLQSIDALRGFDMFWIIKGSNLAKALAVLLGLPALAEQFGHSKWDGFLFYDLIFPLFIFVVGAVLPFSLAKYRQDAVGVVNYREAYLRIARRAILLFGLGLIYSGILQLNFEGFRWPGVLQRIAICYFFAALAVVHLNVAGQSILLFTLLVGYWCLLLFVPAPGFEPYDLTKEGSLVGYLDRVLIPGRLIYRAGDNEGFLSTFPAIGNALMGVLAGEWLRSTRKPGMKVLGLYFVAALCLLAGYYWAYFAPIKFPLNKILWTSSFVLVTGGWSLALLATFYGIIDVLGWKRWAFFFIVIGMNAITIYLMQQFVDFNKMSDFFLGGINRYLGLAYENAPDSKQLEAAQNAVRLTGVLTIEWLILWYLYRNKTFLRV